MGLRYEFDSLELREIAKKYKADYLSMWWTTERVEFWNSRRVGQTFGRVRLYKKGTFRISGEWFPEEIDFLIKTLKQIKRETVL